jgi:hypothetical protein
MGYLCIREPKNASHIPGTVLHHGAENSSLDDSCTLKNVKWKNGHIVLNPQPNDDPNDPLNFSQAKKLLKVAITSFGVCIFGATVSPLLNVGLVDIAGQLDTSVARWYKRAAISYW